MKKKPTVIFFIILIKFTITLFLLNYLFFFEVVNCEDNLSYKDNKNVYWLLIFISSFIVISWYLNLSSTPEEIISRPPTPEILE